MLYPFALEAQFGVGALLGFVGVALDWAVLPALSINLGGGTNLRGPQIAASARFRPFKFGRPSQYAPYVSVGNSEGPYTQLGISPLFHDAPTAWAIWDAAFWAGGEVGFEMRLAKKFELRPSVGCEWLMNPNGARVVAAGSVQEWVPYTGVAVGYAF